ncbi:fasciclin domain-containing protein [Chitinophaga flava]|uniref:FAS1 domain-containing protein n=1 Tax=Chitinophaga flava TaxID=2259036 RepID=A0A365XYE9_9BACT|nr:fasciclin domain-containing protein [Chitinophaga flava]RBL91382.1 hypothetical protein DF182_01815 [Chitinophaga flava]
MKFFIYTMTLSMLFFSACRLKDAQVTPVGEPLPYNGPSQTVKQILDGSGFTIYKAIWKKVNMDSVMADNGSQAYTLLVPADDAFTKAGMTLNTVNTMPVADLDSLLFYHVVDTWLSGDQLKTLTGSNAMRSLLTRGDLPNYSDRFPYYYYQYLGLHDGKLVINGKPHPLKTMEGTNGTLYVLDEVLKKPEKDMIDYLKNNPDFSMLMEACRINDSIYRLNWGSQGFTQLLSTDARSKQFTFFAPTNQAFQKAGFNTVDDLRKRALRWPVGYQHYDENGYYVTPYTSLDSMFLANHLDYSGATQAEYPLQLFSNDLMDNPALANYLIKAGSLAHPPSQYIRLVFTSSAAGIMVRQLNSPSPAVPLATTDLLFRNGVIHVINDGMLMP